MGIASKIVKGGLEAVAKKARRAKDLERKAAEAYAQMPEYLQDPYLGLSTSNIGKVTGNVFGNAFANAVATISANITSIRVVDASRGQEIPGTTSNTVVVTTNTVYTASNSESVSLVLKLNNNVSANIGDYITQKYANTTVAANLRVLETVSTVANIAVIKISGTVTTLTGNTVQINGVTANANVASSPTVIGSINSNGAVVISNRTLTTGNVWGNVYASSNIGNITVSTTTAAAFLKASPGYTP
jgi:hypothetical protein